ncbi:MAG: hypothetical protein ACOZQL_10740 [Myxococcota bacterium]
MQQLSTGATYETAAEAIGLAAGTIAAWMDRGQRESSGRYHDFVVAVRKARAGVVQRLLARAQKRVMPKKEGGEGADPLPLLAIIDRRYQPSVRLTIANELNATLDRLEQEFADEPEILERILSAIAEETGPGAVAPAPRSSHREDPRGGAPVGEGEPERATEGLPRDRR